MRKISAKTLFTLLVILVISTLFITACVDAGSATGTSGKGKGQGNNNTTSNNNTTGDDDSGSQGKAKGQSGDDDNSSGNNTSGDDTSADDDSGSQGKGQGQADDDTSGDDTSGDDTSADDDSGSQGKGQGQADDDSSGDDTSGDDAAPADDDDTGNGNNGQGGGGKITLCHATGSATNPYVEITVSVNAVNFEGHGDHENDIIPAPKGGCPGPEPTPPPHPGKITLCHATGSATNPYVEITVSVNAVNFAGHGDHENDIIPAPADGCPGGEKTSTPPPNPGKITLCHATGSATNPYVEITVSVNAVNFAGHGDHENDIIPAPADGCPGGEETPTPTPPPGKVGLCHATSSATNPYVFIEVSVNAVNFAGHGDHENDIIPANSADDCPGGPTPTLPTPTPTPTSTPTPPPGTVYLCHYTGDAAAPYEVVEVSDNGTFDGHDAHAQDIYPVPSGGCPGPDPTPTPRPTIEPEVSAVCVDFVIFHTLRDGNLEIYRLEGSEASDSYTLINLSQGPTGQDSRPSRSWDDSMIVFESDRNGNVELYLNSTSGGVPVRLTNSTSNNINAAFLADDKTVVYQSDRNGNWDIFSLNLETGEERQLTTDPNDDIYPFPSPNPDWITFQTNRNGNWDVYLLNVVTGEQYGFAISSANETMPAWSPDGANIAFLSDYAGETDLWIQNVATNDKFVLTWGADNTANNHSWSPDGTRIAYQSERNGNLDIYTYDLTDDVEYRATTYAGTDASPSWDCSGENVSFTSLRNDDINVFQVYWQGGDNLYLTTNPAVDKWSQWSPSKEQGSRGQ